MAVWIFILKFEAINFLHIYPGVVLVVASKRANRVYQRRQSQYSITGGRYFTNGRERMEGGFVFFKNLNIFVSN
ncbi:MAG: hypothetical protein A2275_08250 [Bacteroidetes bacterium RIFOXYA12_FULL_35_11]|nr:MAG: hypothetical protein A2X01_09270 [Bacteroidetes bacterium GWF2_35_48]OFY72522.1 MAG: hypothetical protein A2275_08250 [Bacteroidetes bacterium RIFOXYA12_FULL_35_11]OFY96890.1 MAG: hypothetical protein A2309_04795 [Bacteroidetes bacterium RIFOXYB2_FULL_35_7]HBX50227.1 hypothetical protein [Bacteroidales bacterium]